MSQKLELITIERSIIFKIFSASIKYSENESNPENILFVKDKIIITHYEGILICHEIQIPNKKRMKAKEVLNGNHLKSFFKAK